jgi:hypothetical protein
MDFHWAANWSKWMPSAMARVSINPPQIWEEPPMKVAAKYSISAVFRFVISPVLVLLSSTFYVCDMPSYAPWLSLRFFGPNHRCPERWERLW